MRPLLVFGLVVSVAACGGGGGPTFQDDHPRIYLSENRDRLVAALQAGAPAATRFQDMVDRQMGGADLYGFDSWFAALMGQLTGDGAYCDYAVQLADAEVSAEEAQIGDGSAPEVARDSYLYVGPTIESLTLTYDWCFDHASGGQKERWLAYAGQAVWNVWHPDEAQWHGISMPWSGWSIDNPSNNYHYSFLRATMLFGLAAHGEDPDAQGWLDFFRDQKIGAELVPTFDADLVGGGSREGTGYGVSMRELWWMYDVWEASTGERIADLTPHTRASLLYYLHAAAPTRDRLAPIGDHARDSTAALYDYDRDYVQTLAYLFPGDPLAGKAKTFLDTSSVSEEESQFNYVYDYLYDQSAVTGTPLDTLGTSFYGPGTGEVFSRSSWDTDATWLSFIAGPYTESHAHHDQGSLMLYKDGWLAYDPLVDSTSGIRQEDELHNLVRLDGLEQHLDTISSVTALHRGDGWLHVAADVLPAYDGDPAVQLDQRELVYLQPDVVVVFDRVTTDSGVGQIWQLSSPGQPSISGAHATISASGHTLAVDRVAPASGATATVHDWTDDGDFHGGYRLDDAVPGGARVMLHVLSIDGAASAIAPADADSRTGVSFTLADGRHVTVRFSATGVDGTLDLDGNVTALGPGVDSLPE